MAGKGNPGHERRSEASGTLSVVASSQLQRLDASLAGDVVDPAGLAVRAADVAAWPRSPETRRTYGEIYRTF